MQSMQEATNAFVEGANWLTADDRAAVAALQHTAIALDENYTPSAMGQWRSIYNDLRNRKQEEQPTEELSEDELALRDLGL